MENVQGVTSTPLSNVHDLELVRSVAEKCQDLVNQAVAGFITREQFLERIKDSGASSGEAEDYVEQLSQRLRQIQSPETRRDQSPGRGRSPPPEREQTPDGLVGQEAIDFRAQRDALLSAAADHAGRQNEAEKRKAAVESVAWAVLKAKLAQLDDPPTVENAHSSDDLPEDLFSFLGLSRSSPGSIPTSILAVAPHLGKLSSQIKADPHLDETRKYRNTFNKSDQVRDALVNELQLFRLAEPLSRSIWKKIVQDDFVDFEKLYASMERGYDHKDDPKPFTEDFAIVKKDQATAKRTLHTEAEWIRVFSAWESGVVVLFPHRTGELQAYRQIVMELFRATPGRPQLAIHFDLEVRDRYAKKPFHMDDRSELNIPLLAQMFRSSAPALSKGVKHPSSTPTNSTKRMDVPCRNWNFGKCADPCENRRKHGVCCICGELHRAKDNDQCFTSLKTRA
jgi:hypothetical protein